MTTFGRLDPVPVERFSGPGWAGMKAVIACAIDDPETGFHPIAGECLWAVLSAGPQSGTSVTDVARRHGLNSNQVFNWRKLWGTQPACVSACKFDPRAVEVQPPLTAVGGGNVARLLGASERFLWQPTPTIALTRPPSRSGDRRPASAWPHRDALLPSLCRARLGNAPLVDHLQVTVCDQFGELRVR
jgi:Transposase